MLTPELAEMCLEAQREHAMSGVFDAESAARRWSAAQQRAVHASDDDVETDGNLVRGGPLAAASLRSFS